MTFSGFLAYVGALTIAAVIPGPQIFAMVAQALWRGRRAYSKRTAPSYCLEALPHFVDQHFALLDVFRIISS
jgi:hypothetical protein